MKIKNRMGPRTLPSGALASTGKGDERIALVAYPTCPHIFEIIMLCNVLALSLNGEESLEL